LLDQKVIKNQGFIKIGCVSKPEVSLAIQGMIDFNKFMAFVVAVYCYTHSFHTYLRQEPLSYFSNASPPPQQILFFWHHCGTKFWRIAQFSGFRDRPNRNFTTDVDEGKQCGHVGSPTCSGQENTSITCCQDDVPNISNLVLRAFAKVYICVKFTVSIDFLVLLCHDKRTKSKLIEELLFW